MYKYVKYSFLYPNRSKFEQIAINTLKYNKLISLHPSVDLYIYGLIGFGIPTSLGIYLTR